MCSFVKMDECRSESCPEGIELRRAVMDELKNFPCDPLCTLWSERGASRGHRDSQGCTAASRCDSIVAQLRCVRGDRRHAMRTT